MSSLQSGDNAEPNLVPMLDMVFQLITFFMLVINFKNANFDRTLQLPVVGSARPVPATDDESQTIVLNIDRDGKLKVQGGERTDIQQYIAEEGHAAQAVARAANANFKPGDDLPITVVVRADKETRFNLLYRVIKACQQQGFRSFNYMAMNRDSE